jgi:hypothetical protein
VLSGTVAGVVELSGSVIESPQGLHSNAYKFSANARLMICKVIGLPQTGQATSLLNVRSSLIWIFVHAMARSNLDADQHIGKKPPRGHRPWPPWHMPAAGRYMRPRSKRGFDISTLAGQTNSLL